MLAIDLAFESCMDILKFGQKIAYNLTAIKYYYFDSDIGQFLSGFCQMTAMTAIASSASSMSLKGNCNLVHVVSPLFKSRSRSSTSLAVKEPTSKRMMSYTKEQ